MCLGLRVFVWTIAIDRGIRYSRDSPSHQRAGWIARNWAYNTRSGVRLEILMATTWGRPMARQRVGILDWPFHDQHRSSSQAFELGCARCCPLHQRRVQMRPRWFWTVRWIRSACEPTAMMHPEFEVRLRVAQNWRSSWYCGTEFTTLKGHHRSKFPWGDILVMHLQDGGKWDIAHELSRPTRWPGAHASQKISANAESGMSIPNYRRRNCEPLKLPSHVSTKSPWIPLIVTNWGRYDAGNWTDAPRLDWTSAWRTVPR